jgi:cytochrome c-type biogenesis protein
MDLILAYLAGLLTLINPCVLPVLPIVLASTLQAHRLGPVAMAGGMAVSFVVLGMIIAAAGQSLGLTEETVARIGAFLLIGFGLVLLVPAFGARFATATGGIAVRADRGIDGLDRSGLGGQVLAGALLGAVWSPCIGPTLGGAISLASQGQSLLWAAAVMTAFSAGVATIILALGYGARAAILRRRDSLRALAEWARPVTGVLFLLLGVAILFSLHHMAEAWLMNILPDWLIDLSVSL